MYTDCYKNTGDSSTCYASLEDRHSYLGHQERTHEFGNTCIKLWRIDKIWATKDQNMTWKECGEQRNRGRNARDFCGLVGDKERWELELKAEVNPWNFLGA